MANVGQIDYLTDIGTFLKASEITSLQSQLKKINNLTATCITPLNNEMNLGLSAEALNIGGRAPLNELAQELKNKMQTTIDSITDLSGIIKGEGNTHRQQEANKYYEKVMERYNNNLRKDAIDAKNNYNNHRDYTVTITETEIDNDVDTDGSATRAVPRQEYRQYDECILTNETGTGRISITSIDPKSGYCKGVQIAVENAQNFYDYYVKKAEKLKNECDGLSTSISASPKSTASATPTKGTESSSPKSGQTSAATTRESEIIKSSKMIQETKDRARNKVVEYEKDGKMISITYDRNGNVKTIKEYSDADGRNLNRRFEYDTTGNENVYEYGYVEVRDYNDIRKAVSNGETFKIPQGSTFTYDYLGGTYTFDTKDRDIYFAKKEDGTYGILNEDDSITPAFQAQVARYDSVNEQWRTEDHYLEKDTLLNAENNDALWDQNNTRYIRPDGQTSIPYTQQDAVEINSYNDIKNAAREMKPFKIKQGTTFIYDAPYIGEDKFDAKDGDIYFAPTENGNYGQLAENGNITTVKTSSTTQYLDRDTLLSGTNSDKKISQNNTRYEDHYD